MSINKSMLWCHISLQSSWHIFRQVFSVYWQQLCQYTFLQLFLNKQVFCSQLHMQVLEVKETLTESVQVTDSMFLKFNKNAFFIKLQRLTLSLSV